MLRNTPVGTKSLRWKSLHGLANSSLPQGPPVASEQSTPVMSWLSKPSQGLLRVIAAAPVTPCCQFVGNSVSVLAHCPLIGREAATRLMGGES